MTTTYTVRPKRWDHGYELHIEGLGVTQVDDMSEAEEVARDYIALDLEVPEDSFDLEIAPVPPETIEVPAAINLADLEAWERHVWLTPNASVEERQSMIALVRITRGVIDPNLDSVVRLRRALEAVLHEERARLTG